MALDRATVKFLEELAEAGGKPLAECTPEEARASGADWAEFNGPAPEMAGGGGTRNPNCRRGSPHTGPRPNSAALGRCRLLSRRRMGYRFNRRVRHSGKEAGGADVLRRGLGGLPPGPGASLPDGGGRLVRCAGMGREPPGRHCGTGRPADGRRRQRRWKSGRGDGPAIPRPRRPCHSLAGAHLPGHRCRLQPPCV